MDPIKENTVIDKMNHLDSRMVGLSRGVSLIESLAALLVFMFGVLGWLGLEMAIAEESLQTQARSQAAFIANATADFLKQIPYDQLADSADDVYYDKDALETDDTSVFTVSWISNELPVGAPEYKDVTIQVAWMTNKNGLQSVLDLRFERAP